MTTITVFKRGLHIVGFEAIGHSGYGEAGGDIVCSAVSAITQTALIGIVEVLEIDAEWEQDDDGWLSLMLPDGLSIELNAKAEAVLDTMNAGLKATALDYGDYVTIKERKV